MVKSMNVPIKRIFLADGDAMTLPVKRLKEILTLISAYFPKLQRVSSYCLPRNVREKSVEDLRELREMGLGLVYVGCESGDDEVCMCLFTYMHAYGASVRKHHERDTYILIETFWKMDTYILIETFWRGIHTYLLKHSAKGYIHTY